ncbi:MAG TPA: response regulator transcription factor [Anaerolineales bacterium]|nr:response regulator transcription factor [Anaerolineales bacterium]
MLSGKVLIIDDEASLRHTLARILQNAGSEVTTAASGKEALALIAKQEFDLVYLDVRMPDMNGVAVLKTIHAGNPDLSVVLFTAQPDVHSAVEALRLGAKDYLVKPIQPDTLLERTNALLFAQAKERRKRRLQQQIEDLQTKLDNIEAEEPTAELSIPLSRSDERYLRLGPFRLDLHARRVTIGETTTNLPPTSFDYLLVLARHTPDVVDYQTLVAEAQGYQADPREAQELAKWHVHHIRQALESDPHSPQYLINVRGKGYRFVAD